MSQAKRRPLVVSKPKKPKLPIAATPLLVSRKDAARLLGNVDVSTIRRLENAGVLHPIRLDPRSPRAQVFFKYEEIIATAGGQVTQKAGA
jgi:hypothetical protein